jgi:hypothetical protein
MIRLGAAVTAIEETDECLACCRGGTSVEADAAILRPI